MFIEKAFAADVDVPGTTATGSQVAPLPPAPGFGEAFATNMGMVLVLVIMFYFLLIKPQQRRFKEHSNMLSALKKGDRVVTGGGIIGTIDKISDGDEVIVDLGNGIKVTALRSTIQGKDDPHLRKKAANDVKTAKEKEDNKK